MEEAKSQRDQQQQGERATDQPAGAAAAE